jgi:hypothetical protein
MNAGALPAGSAVPSGVPDQGRQPCTEEKMCTNVAGSCRNIVSSNPDCLLSLAAAEIHLRRPIWSASGISRGCSRPLQDPVHPKPYYSPAKCTYRSWHPPRHSPECPLHLKVHYILFLIKKINFYYFFFNKRNNFLILSDILSSHPIKST